MRQPTPDVQRPSSQQHREDRPAPIGAAVPFHFANPGLVPAVTSADLPLPVAARCGGETKLLPYGVEAVVTVLPRSAHELANSPPRPGCCVGSRDCHVLRVVQRIARARKAER